MKRLQFYLSVAQMLHLMVLAIGTALIAGIFNPRSDGLKISLGVLVFAGILVWLTYIYIKINDGTSKKRNR